MPASHGAPARRPRCERWPSRSRRCSDALEEPRARARSPTNRRSPRWTAFASSKVAAHVRSVGPVRVRARRVRQDGRVLPSAPSDRSGPVRPPRRRHVVRCRQVRHRRGPVPGPRAPRRAGRARSRRRTCRTTRWSASTAARSAGRSGSRRSRGPARADDGDEPRPAQARHRPPVVHRRARRARRARSRRGSMPPGAPTWPTPPSRPTASSPTRTSSSCARARAPRPRSTSASGDYVNMGLAREFGLPVVVVGDIDRGGILASLYGTWALLDEDDRALLKSFVINKFRGDVSVLEPGLDDDHRRAPACRSTASSRGCSTCGSTARTPSRSATGAPPPPCRRRRGTGSRWPSSGCPASRTRPTSTPSPPSRASTCW